MEFAAKHEIEGLKGDIARSKDQMRQANAKYEQELKNGLLDEIRREISTPSKPSIRTGFKNKIRQIKDTLSIMFFQQ